MFGFYRVAAAVPEIRVADVDFNTLEIKKLVAEADRQGAALVVFPELCVTGYTCADLFHQTRLTDKVYSALAEIADFAKAFDIVAVVGAPLFFRSRLFNCAVVIHNGKILAAVPKSFNPNYREFYEKRWFASGKDVISKKLEMNGDEIPFGTNIVFEHDSIFSFGIEICEDLWNVIPPSCHHSIAGATINVNLSASNELVG
ncbi:MAG: nitrilase-related carbon-nitrogen hydrolase, partial [Victivallales bacterium]